MPALSYFGRMVWAQTLPDMSAGKHLAEMSTCFLLDNAGFALDLMPLIHCAAPYLFRAPIRTHFAVLESYETSVCHCCLSLLKSVCCHFCYAHRQREEVFHAGRQGRRRQDQQRGVAGGAASCGGPPDPGRLHRPGALPLGLPRSGDRLPPYLSRLACSFMMVIDSLLCLLLLSCCLANEAGASQPVSSVLPHPSTSSQSRPSHSKLAPTQAGLFVRSDRDLAPGLYLNLRPTLTPVRT